MPIGLPMRELIFGLIRLSEPATGCCVKVEGIFMLLILVFVWLFVLVFGCRILPRIELAKFPELILPVVGLRRFALTLGRDVVERLDVILVELRLGWLTTGALVVLFLIMELEFLDLTEG